MKKKEGKKFKSIGGGEGSDAETTGAEGKEKLYSAANQAGEAVKVDKALFQEWSVGDVNKI